MRPGSLAVGWLKILIEAVTKNLTMTRGVFRVVGKRALDKFDSDLRQVSELMRFDDRVLSYILTPLEAHDLKLANSAVGKHLRPTGLITNIRNIRSHESLKTHYRALYNQWLVLLVSYFSAAVRELFIDMAADAIRDRRQRELMREVLKVRVEQLVEAQDDIPTHLADLLASSDNISFQDMGSILRLFSHYFECEIDRDADVNDIILAQASRHVIVHAGAVVDRKMIAQLKVALPRTLKPKLRHGEQLDFAVSEIDNASASMRRFLERLIKCNQGVVNQ